MPATSSVVGPSKTDRSQFGDDLPDADYAVAQRDRAHAATEPRPALGVPLRGVFPSQLDVFDAGPEDLDELMRIAAAEPGISRVQVDADGSFVPRPAAGSPTCR